MTTRLPIGLTPTFDAAFLRRPSSPQLVRRRLTTTGRFLLKNMNSWSVPPGL
jgi:hypothetical protein